MPRNAAKADAPGNIEKRGDVYRLRLHVGGRMHRFTFPPGTPIEGVRRFATEQARELQRHAAKRKRRTGRAAGTDVRMADLLDVYEAEHVPLLAPRTQTSYRESCALFRRFFVERGGNPLVDDVGGKDVEAFMAWRRVTPGDARAATRKTPAALLAGLEGQLADARLSPAELATALGVASSWIHVRAARRDAPLPSEPGGLRGGRVFAVGAVRSWLRDEGERERQRRRTTVSNRTVQRDRAILHRIFRVALRRELVDTNPVARTEAPKADPHTPVLLEAEQYERLLAAAAGRPMLALYLMLLGEAGLRSKSEALWLRWEHVDLEQGFLWIASTRVHRTKGGKGRWVPLTPRLREAFREHLATYRLAVYDGQRSAWVFHHERTRRRHTAGARIASLDASARGAVRRAKLPEGFRNHDLRHRRVTTWLGEGANPVHVKEAVGHADLKTTMAYTHLSREHLRSLVAPSAGPAASQEGRQEGRAPARPTRQTGGA